MRDRAKAPTATIADLLAIPEQHRRHEIIDGVLVEKEAASGRHGGAQVAIEADRDVAVRGKSHCHTLKLCVRAGGWRRFLSNSEKMANLLAELASAKFPKRPW